MSGMPFPADWQTPSLNLYSKLSLLSLSFTNPLSENVKTLSQHRLLQLATIDAKQSLLRALCICFLFPIPGVPNMPSPGVSLPVPSHSLAASGH